MNISQPLEINVVEPLHLNMNISAEPNPVNENSPLTIRVTVRSNTPAFVSVQLKLFGQSLTKTGNTSPAGNTFTFTLTAPSHQGHYSGSVTVSGRKLNTPQPIQPNPSPTPTPSPNPTPTPIPPGPHHFPRVL